MKRVAPLRYDVIFKKAFCDPQIFMAFVKDALGITIEIDKVETEKSFKPAIGRVASRFDLFAQDVKNRVIVDIQHVRYSDNYDAFLHYHCAAILEQIVNAKDYRPGLAVYTIVVLTRGDKHKKAKLTIDFDPKDDDGIGIGEIPHKVLYLCPKYASDRTPKALRQWLNAIDDTLDEEVEENNYLHPQIRRIFDLIETDAISPEERAEMIEENHRQEVKEEGFKEGVARIVQTMFAEGFADDLIARLSGLTLGEIESLKKGKIESAE